VQTGKVSLMPAKYWPMTIAAVFKLPGELNSEAGTPQTLALARCSAVQVLNGLTPEAPWATHRPDAAVTIPEAMSLGATRPILPQGGGRFIGTPPLPPPLPPSR